MQTLYKPKSYPQEIIKEINRSGALGIALANRWMLGWPETVKELIAANEYLSAFLDQLEQERDALAANTDNWLSSTEKIAMAGLRQSPPTIS